MDSRAKRLVGCAILMLAVVCSVWDAGAQETDPCLSKQTQGEMNSCEGRRYREADAKLNSVYQQLLKKYANDGDFIKRLRISEEAWLKYRDADLDSVYYKGNKLGSYGSVYPMCRVVYLFQLTAQRIKELEQMLNPAEGDVCGFLASNEADDHLTRR